jgi:hypothetical protein
MMYVLATPTRLLLNDDGAARQSVGIHLTARGLVRDRICRSGLQGNECASIGFDPDWIGKGQQPNGTLGL